MNAIEFILVFMLGSLWGMFYREKEISMTKEEAIQKKDIIVTQFINELGVTIETNAKPLIHCKDCKHWSEEKDEEDDILYGWCRAPFENDNLLVYGDDATRIFTAYDFFCKSGERREDGEEE